MYRTSVVIIGAGQAGLAASYLLSAASVDHVVLERCRTAESRRRSVARSAPSASRRGGEHQLVPPLEQHINCHPGQFDVVDPFLPHAVQPLPMCIDNLGINIGDGFSSHGGTRP